MSEVTNNKGLSLLDRVAGKYDRQQFQKLNEEMSFNEYLELVQKTPRVARNAHQRVYDMIDSKGSYSHERYRKTLTHYNFFDDPEIPIYDLEETLDEVVKFIKGAAGHYGTEKRVLLLHGPVGSAKSTILRLIKRGLEKYSRTDEGAWYSYKWVGLPTGQDGIYTHSEDDCPMNEDPLKLMPAEMRKAFVAELNVTLLDSVADDKKNTQYTLEVRGELNPRCKKFMGELLKRYGGDWKKVVAEHIRVVRKVHSEADRVGIATFQPKDEKNQDSTELTGDINFAKIPHFGSDSDARAFNFDGEFCFPAGTPVRMANGSEKSVESVKIGDHVVTHKGRVRPVTDTMSRSYTGDMVDMTVSGFPFPLTMTADHPVAVLPSRCDWRWQPGELQWKKAGDLTPNDRVVLGYNREQGVDGRVDLVGVLDKHVVVATGIKKPGTMDKNAVPTTVKVNSALARFIGVYIAEGGCYEGKKVVFNLAADEESLANEIIDLGQRLFGASGTTRLVNERKTGRVVEFHNSNLHDAIKHIVPGDVYSKRVPPLFFSASEEVKEALLIGWFDGDGCSEVRVQKGKPSVRMTGVTASNGLARDMCVLALSCGMVARVEKRKPRNRSRTAYAVVFSGRKAVGLVPSLAQRAVASGINLWASDTNRTEYGYARTVKSVERRAVEDLPVYDFEVEEDHSFLANDIVVHNCVGNRGVVEFIEMLKLETAFLYDLLGASQEQSIKPKKFSQIGVDEIIIGHTNQADFEKLKNNQFMEALRDRTVKVDVPYITRASQELKVLEQDYGPGKVRQHVAPHTLEIAALWAVLTRLQDDKDGKLDLIQKAELYDGKLLPGWTEDSVKELMMKHPGEGMTTGVSVRYVQDKISNCLSARHDYINFFMVLNEIKEGLNNSSLITNKDQISRYLTCVELAVKKLDEILKTEVQRALVGDEDAIVRLCANYIDNVMAYMSKAKVRNKITGRDEPHDERLMRNIETRIKIPEQGADDFRRMIAAFIGDMAHKHQKDPSPANQFKWDSNPLLKKALEAKLYEDTKDHIKLSALNVSGATVVQPDLQEKIDAIKTRLIKQYGYNEQSASDVLDYVGSIFARGDLAEKD